MRSSLLSLALLYSAPALGAPSFGLKRREALQTCPLLAKQYPAPVDLTNEPDFIAATKSITAAINANINQLPANETTFSLGMFSTSQDGLIYQYHHTSPAVANSSNGTKQVDADSVYRIGSISKLLTVYLFLVNAGDRYWGIPITEVVPQLSQLSSQQWNPLTPEWHDITIGDLAAQMAGLSRDYGLADFAPPDFATIPIPPFVKPAFPPLPKNEIPTCGYLLADGSFPACNQEEYLEGITSESPIFPTGYTPVYSNEAYALIGLALAEITKSSFESVFNKTFIDTLGLHSTSYTVPGPITDKDVIPGDPLTVGWSPDLGFFGPAGGYFSSTNDFAKLGKAILNSTLLTPGQTRRWFKPTGFVERWSQGVGRPWEIFRVEINGQSIDIYTKAGDWGVYATSFMLLPMYNFGFSLFTAVDLTSTATSEVRADLPNTIINTIVPALDQVAKKQAAATFAGRYTSSKLKSSIAFGTDEKSGLMLTEWINNGTDVLAFFELLAPNLDYRILPNELNQGNTVGFTSYFQSAAPPEPNGTWYLQCPGWLDVDELVYGNIPVGQFVFTVGSDGKATCVEERALRITLEKATGHKG